MRNSYMFRKSVLAAAFFAGSLTVLNAQTTLSAVTRSVTRQPASQPDENHGGDFHVCPSGRLTREYIEENGLQAVAQAGYQERLNTPVEESADRAVRTVPVVFHIVYNTSSENVSDAVINNLLLRLNQDFRKNNSLISNIRPAFTSIAADAQIEFCLATKDPSGNTLATPGITRTTTTCTYFNPDNDNVSGNVGGANSMKTAQYGKAPWDRTKYINIWICDITNGASYGTAGYAYVPQGTTTGGLPPANLDGIVLDYNIGVQGGNSRAVSHEMGDYFGLDHTFGDPTGVCNAGSDDGFTDTPRIKDAFQNVYSSCNSATTAQSCQSGVLWQYENLMDYSNCFCMFTTQQANHMNSVLSGSRNSLNTSYTTNCAAPTPQVPVAAFNGCNSAVTQGSTVTFTDVSTGIPTSWSWSITPATGWSYVGGTSATSQNPQVQFNTLGTYNVALTATNAQGSNTKTSNSCITVVTAPPCNNLSSPLVMGFELADTVALADWTVENTNGDQNSNGEENTWGFFQSQTGLTAHGGSFMIGYLYNDDGVTSANDWLFTPCLALQQNITYSISFWHKVGSSGGTTFPEKLRVKIGNTNTSVAMTQTIVDLGTLTNTGWVQSTSTFTVPATGNYTIGFQCYSAADKFFLVVDDINISALSSPAPVANFTGCGNYTTGNTVTFTNTSTGSPTSYSWSITPATGWSYTGGTNASSANPQVTFNTAGTYTVALTATNAGGSNTKTSTGCVVVTAGAVAPTANFTGCGSYTTGNTVTFTNTSTGSPTSYSWSITPVTGWSYTGGTNASSANPQVTFSAAGTYTVALTASNSAGSNTKTSNSCVVVTGTTLAPVANFTGCGNYTVGNVVTFTNTSTNSPTSFSWSITPATGWFFAGGTNASSANPQVVFSAAGTYTVALTAANTGGSHTKTSTGCVVATAGVVAPVAGFTGCGNYSTGSTVTFTNTSTNSPTSYAWSITPGTGWSFTGGTNATSANPQVTFNTAGTYSVTLTAINSAGSDVETSSNCVVVSNGVVAPVAGFTGCGTFVTGSTVTLTNTSTNSPTSYSWSITPGTGWSFTGGTNASSPNPQIMFTGNGSYTIALTAGNSAGNNTFISNACVIINSTGAAPVADFLGCPGTVPVNSTVTFANTSSNLPTSNSWSITPATGWSFTGGTGALSENIQVQFTSEGSYTVALTATNAQGSNTKTTSSCVIVGSAGINESALASGVFLYPNPTTGMVTLSIGNVNDYTNLTVTVYNAVGMQVFKTSNVPSELSLDLSAYSSGIYFVEVRSNEAVTTKRLVVGK